MIGVKMTFVALLIRHRFIHIQNSKLMKKVMTNPDMQRMILELCTIESHLCRFSMKKDMTKKTSRRVKWMKILQLCLAIIPPIVFGIFPIIFTIQQDASAKAMREQDQQQADETNRRILFKEYIDDMKELLLKGNFSENIEQSLLYIRIQTLTVLRHLDADRKRDVILFLYENRLLKHNQYPRIDLAGADLNGLVLKKAPSRPCDLPSLYLAGVSAENAVFEACQLSYAIFNDASMPNVRFHSCQLPYSSFINANMSRTHLINNHLYGSNFTGAILAYSTIKSGVFQAMNLTNTDLYQSDISDRLLEPTRYGGVAPNIFLNTRYPNGSFSQINQANLMTSDHPNATCYDNLKFWADAFHQTRATPKNTSELPSDVKVHLNSDCFVSVASGQTLVNPIDLRQYSLLINMERLKFNFTVSLGLINGTDHDEIAINVHYAHEDGTFDFMAGERKSISKPSILETHSIFNRIPSSTSRLLVSIACNVISSPDRFCYFNQVYLHLFR